MCIKKTVVKLNEIEQARLSGQLKPYPAGAQRMDMIIQGLKDIAQDYGFNLKSHIQCDSNGEIMFSGKLDQDGFSPSFGSGLASLLNTIYVRTGIQSCIGHVMPINGWCRINHFEAEKMIRNHHASVTN